MRVIGIDMASGKDQTCFVLAEKAGDGVIHIRHVFYWPLTVRQRVICWLWSVGGKVVYE